MYTLNDAINEKAKQYGFQFTNDEVLAIVSKHWDKIGNACGQSDVKVTAKVLQEVATKEIENRKKGKPIEITSEQINGFRFLKNATKKGR